MQHLLRSKSLLLFTLVFCSFFSCQQLLDVIKPQPSKPSDKDCRLLTETTSSADTLINYEYDNMGRVTGIVYNPDPFLGISDGLTYDASNQIIKQNRSRFRRGDFERTFEYDNQGRVVKDVAEVSAAIPFTTTNEYTYTPTTIKVRTTLTTPIEEPKTWETTYIFQNDNLVKVRYDKSQNGEMDGYEITYSYSTTLNKLSNFEKQLSYVKNYVPEAGTVFSPLMSKNLVSQSADSNGRMSTYQWELNPQGYPARVTLTAPNGTTTTLYNYDCRKK